MYTILLVDDERHELEMLCHHIQWRDMGMSVCATALSGQEALEKITLLRPDILLTDVKMPGMDGLALARAVRAEYPFVKIAFLSGHNDFAYVQSALGVEASGYLLKPVNPDELEALMRRIQQKCDADRTDRTTHEFGAAGALRGQLYNPGDDSAQREALNACAKYFSISREQLPTTPFYMALLAIDEYPYLSQYAQDGAEILGQIESALTALSRQDDRLRCTIVPGRHLLLSRTPLAADVRALYSRLPAGGHHLSTLLSPGPAPFAEVSAQYSEMDTRWYQALMAGKSGVLIQDSSDTLARQVDALAPESLLPLLQSAAPDALSQWVTQYLQGLRQPDAHYAQSLKQGTLMLLNFIYERVIEPHATVAARFSSKAYQYGQVSTIEGPAQMGRFLVQLITKVQSVLRSLEGNQLTRAIEAVKQTIQTCIDQPLTIDFLAQQAYLSPNYLRAVFKEHTGQTILEYITGVRIQKACELLADPKLRIHEIAALVGYETASHFITVFSKKVGCTPHQYRSRLNG